jgi:Domain of unknown function (DUF4261)
MEPLDPTDEGLLYQMEVYFDEFPEIDVEALAAFVNQCDPDETDVCEIDFVKDETLGEVRISASGAILGEFQMAILIHSVPSPGRDWLHDAHMPDEVRERMLGHRCFALLTNVGGEGYAPIENHLFLLKVAIGLCKQGGFGAGNPHTGRAFPSDLLLQMVEEEPLAEDAATLWSRLRSEGEPYQLLVDITGFEHEGKVHLLTRGYALCGLPDMICEVGSDEEIEEISDLFANSFGYMVANGPVLHAGDTVGFDENVAFRFDDAPDWLDLPWPTGTVLKVTREKVE